MLCRRLAKGPDFITGHLLHTNVPMQGWDNAGPCYYSLDGEYELGTLGHITYEHTDEDAMLHVMGILHGNKQYRKAEILALLLAGCTQFLVLDPVMHEVGHWYTVGQSPVTQEWVNLDSVLFSESEGYNPVMQDEDWNTLRGEQGATLACFIRKDAYANNGTIRKAHNYQRAPSDNTPSWELPFVNGRTITVYAEQVRSAQCMYATNTPYVRDPATTPTIPPVPLQTLSTLRKERMGNSHTCRMHVRQMLARTLPTLKHP
jgi:hypothetical protein